MFDRVLPDEYSFKARLQPVLLAGLPLAVSLLPWLDLPLGWEALWMIATWAGLSALLAQFVRDRGRQIEKRLFQHWEGRLSTQRLRHRGAANPLRLEHLHRRMQNLLPDVDLPSAEHEASDPAAADAIYEAYVEEARRRTREDKLVFSENCNYGFRRNLLALKPAGIASALVGACLPIAAVWSGESAWGVSVSGTIMISAVMVFVWLFVINPKWVRVAAELYADRLLESVNG